MARPARDPRWIPALRRPSRCARCGQPLAAGERAFYYPHDRSLYCDSEACGRAESRAFLAAAADEDLMLGPPG